LGISLWDELTLHHIVLLSVKVLRKMAQAEFISVVVAVRLA
jgi:hypothetical protein